MGLLDKFLGNNNAAAAAAGNTTQGSAGLAAQSTTGGAPQLPNGLTAAGSTFNIGNGSGNGWITTTTAHIFGGPPLTDSEATELKSLKEQHDEEIKATKMAQFKKLPAELRQFVINMITWSEECSKLEAVSVEKTDRQKELELKEANSGTLNMGGLQWATGGTIHIGTNPQIPAGVSADELKQAHVESTLEEQMLEND